MIDGIHASVGHADIERLKGMPSPHFDDLFVAQDAYCKVDGICLSSLFSKSAVWHFSSSPHVQLHFAEARCHEGAAMRLAFRAEDQWRRVLGKIMMKSASMGSLLVAGGLVNPSLNRACIIFGGGGDSE